MRSIHHRDARHLGWDRSVPAVAEVEPGEVIDLEIVDAGDGQITPDSTSETASRLDPARANPLTGPLWIDGAEPGDAVVVDILALEPSGWGWTAIIPGFGLLADDFRDPFLHHSTYDDDHVAFTPEVRLPARAFPGTLGVAPAEPGCHDVIPPRRVGGNLDTRDLVRGARVHLPVEVPGALLSIGDTHAAQGRGEVCGTAIETAMRVRLRLSVRKRAGLRGPAIEVPPGAERIPGPRHSALGVGPDLVEAARDAVRDLVDHVTAEYGLSPELAYRLASTAADLRIEEIVNRPNWVVSMSLPTEVFR